MSRPRITRSSPCCSSRSRRRRTVTAACISCHNERGREVMASSHWNWARQEYIEGRGIRDDRQEERPEQLLHRRGRATSPAATSATSATAGSTRPSTSTTRGTSTAWPATTTAAPTKRTGGGLPRPAVNLNEVAQHVGRPQRANCGTCHFFGGGGNNVKHGDLEKAMFEPRATSTSTWRATARTCSASTATAPRTTRCSGKVYSLSSMNRNRVHLRAVPHGPAARGRRPERAHAEGGLPDLPHPGVREGERHQDAWDWSTAGRLRDGKPFEENDAHGQRHLHVDQGLVHVGGEREARLRLVQRHGRPLPARRHRRRPIVRSRINTLLGSYDDPDAKIVPVKIHRARQIYDPVTKMLIQPKLVRHARRATAGSGRTSTGSACRGRRHEAPSACPTAAATASSRPR